MNEYQPDSVKVKVNNKRIGGFIESGFMTAGPNSVVLRLHAFSESVEDLASLVGHQALVEVEGSLFKLDERLTNLDISSVYTLADYYTKYNVDKIPEVVFVFGKV